jgi:general secretion pathway protein H
MMALAVMALIAALALPRVYPSAGTTAGRTAAYAVAATLRRDRAEALRTGTPVTTRIDARAGSVTSGATGGRVTLPPGLSLATRAMDDDGITFRPDGSASGGALVLARGETAYSVLVIPLTGGVQIVTGAP